MGKHLSTCPNRQDAIATAESGKSTSDTLYHLRIQDAYAKDFWLDLEMRGSKTLKDLDNYLRAIWLECCGHMSEFYFGGWMANKVSMSQKISKAFDIGTELNHIYDFGTSSETLVKLVGIRTGKPTTSHPIVLMARNKMPEDNCIKCDLPATHLCMECIQEDDTSGLLCDHHTKNHPHDDYGEPIALVNSPRMGMCGYNGPAQPPY
jgi:hypothetical protein